MDVRLLPIDRIVRGPYQPRVHFDSDELQALGESLRRGQINPIVVRALGNKDGDYELIAGERRWRAAGYCGIQQLYARVIDADLVETLSIVWDENHQRDDLTPLEQARFACSAHQTHGLTTTEIGEILGCHRAHVSHLMGLLSLPLTVRELLDREPGHPEGALSGSHGKALASLPDDGAKVRLARKAVQNHWSVRRLEQEVKAWRDAQPLSNGVQGRPERKDPNIERYEQDLTEAVGSPVTIEGDGSQGWRVAIACHDLDVLEGVAERLRRR